MWKLSVFVMLLAARLASSVPALHLSDVEYNKMPKLFSLDHYEDCLVPQDAAFCLATFHLTSPSPSQLYDNMKNISEYELFNYNHTLLHRGLCVTKSCRRFLNSSSREIDTLLPALEACVNDSVHQEYGLEAQVTELKYCKRTGDTIPIGYSEWVVALVVGVLLLLNLAGSVYDMLLKKPDVPGIAWLMAFSVKINWNQLTVIRKDDEGDPRLNNLKAIQGFRVVNTSLVVMTHVMVVAMFRMPPDNPRFMELSPYSIITMALLNAHILQTNLLLASFLVSYNFLIYRETKKRFSWKYLMDAIVQRFFRLTPAYMLVVSVLATWGARYTSGPMCFVLEEERAACRERWWLHFFYINNLFEADLCLPPSWYIAVDFQLFILGMTILVVLWRYPALTRPLLAIGLLIATAIQFYLMYFLNLRPNMLMSSPEGVRTLFRDEPSFLLVHNSPWGNSQAYLLGLIMGITYYKWEKEGYRVYEKKWFRWMHILSFPIGLAWTMAPHRPFLLADHVDQLYLALYGSVDRLMFTFIIMFMVLGCFYKMDTPYNWVCSWRGWQGMGRLSYSVMLLHTITYISMSCAMQYPRQLGLYISMNDFLGNLVITYIAAVPLTLLVEYPLQRLQKILFSPVSDKSKNDDYNGQQVTNSKKIH